MPVDVSALNFGPACPGGFAPLATQTVRVRGGAPFILFSRFFADGTGPLQIYDPGGGAWRAAIYRGASVADGPLAWDASSGSWVGAITAVCSGISSVLYRVRWFPEVIASMACLRGMVDEVDPPGTDLLRWGYPLVMLGGAKSVRTARTSLNLTNPRPPGIFFRVNTRSEPRAGGQLLQFEW